MAHPEILEALALLHTSPAFRAAYLDDAAAALAPLALSGAERAALIGLGEHTWARLGLLADHHRLLRIREHVPWVDPALRPDLAARVRAHLSREAPRLLNREDAVAFCEHLEREDPSPPYLAELARFERFRISVAWGLAPSPAVLRFAYPVDGILAALGAPGWPEVRARATTVEIKKVPRTPSVVIRWS